MLNNGNNAVKYFKYVTPIEHTRTKQMTDKYKGEPYVLAGDMYGNKELLGEAGWTWYTGSSSWYEKVGLTNILGLDIKGDFLEINPCIDENWQKYEIRYKYRETIYNIKVLNPNKKQTGVTKVTENNEEVKDKKITLINDKKTHNIEVIM